MRSMPWIVLAAACGSRAPTATPGAAPVPPAAGAEAAGAEAATIDTRTSTQFALYVARVHRRIHPLWGAGFLAANGEVARALSVDVDLGIGGDGVVRSRVVSRSSGDGAFDAAAMEAARGPFEVPPQGTRSADDVTYLRWTFHADERQCGTGGVEPFVLDAAPARGVLPPSTGPRRAIRDSMSSP